MRESVDQIAERLLARAACFAHGVPIPHALLCRTLQRVNDEYPDEQGTARMLDALALLVNEGALLDRSTGVVLAPHQVEQWQHRFLDADAFTAVIEHLVQRADNLETMEPLRRSVMDKHYRAVADTGERVEHPATPPLLLLIGANQEQRGSLPAAEQSYRRAIAMLRRVWGNDDPLLSVMWATLGNLFTRQGRFADAIAPYRDAARLYHATIGADAPERTEVLRHLCDALCVTGQHREAATVSAEAVACDERRDGPRSAAVAASLVVRAGVQQAQGDLDGAVGSLRRAFVIQEKTEPPQVVAMTLHNLGVVLAAQGKPYEAGMMLMSASERFATVVTEAPREYAQTLVNLGELFAQAGQGAQARQFFQEAVVVGETFPAAGPVGQVAQRRLREVG